MTDLYRGLLEIFVMRCTEQIESLRTHIRSHNSGISENIEFDIGITGFWNLILETLFTIFVVAFLMLGICLTACLAIVSYPFSAIINYVIWLLWYTKNPPNNNPIIIKQNNGEEKK